MKNSLKVVMTVVMLFVINYSQAQIKFGPKVGVNMSTMTMKASGISIDPIAVAGINIGLLTEVPLNKNFVLQPGFLYSTKGSKYNLSGNNISIKPAYFEIPVNVMFKNSLGTTDLLLFAGPYFGAGFAGKYEVPTGTGDINFGSGNADDMKSLDFGMNVGAGVEISSFQITAQYGIGLANLVPVAISNEEMKNRVFGISVAYLFSGN